MREPEISMPSAVRNSLTVPPAGRQVHPPEDGDRPSPATSARHFTVRETFPLPVPSR
jgi:hypothetical protein